VQIHEKRGFDLQAQVTAHEASSAPAVVAGGPSRAFPAAHLRNF